MTTGKSYLYKWLWSGERERDQEKLKDYLGERVDLEDQPHNSIEQFNVMNTLPQNLLLIISDKT